MTTETTNDVLSASRGRRLPSATPGARVRGSAARWKRLLNQRILLTAARAAPCPPGLEPAEAAALPVNGLTAWQALEMLGLGRGQRLLVTNGARATGSLAVQLAAAMGVEVTATASAYAADRAFTRVASGRAGGRKVVLIR
ncbi:hypothetical protein [Actinoallomurus iriomotensis]|uniref:Uncharacterized protein n=1 Tax=Actinoallomurus iriomotensis TaxID=478107 RepID=A0A9W6RXM5_9ACTN|nr:hypothetical protein [Actinoallomurus iriomotensis]GLY83384.1 hypothetical protein Airi02_013140 [Actinoallomurus iriomotensis]